VRTITVDLWGTLIKSGPGTDDRHRRLDDFEDILAAVGERISRAALEQGYGACGGYLARVWSEHRDVPALDHVRAILAAADPTLLDRVGAEVMETLLGAYARPAILAPPAADEGAREALEGLRAAGYRLAVVSNTMRTPGFALRQLLAHHGLLRCFDHATFSDEVGVRKPDPAIFHLALRAVGGEPETSVHVGDDPVLDVFGAHAAGMLAIQVTRSGWPAPELPAPEAEITGLAALPEVVAELDAR
jgi:putative hydrolase of the HAD superfamily